MKFIRGGVKYTGNLNDTVKYFKPFGSKNIFNKVGYKDMGMTVFNTYNGGSPPPADPGNNIETYRVLQGKWRLGESWVNPITQDTTRLVFTGDPVTGTGWINVGGSDRRSVTGTGPMIVKSR